jgi:hypothetical protein
VIVNEIEHGVQIFDKSKLTCLATDRSKDGIGFWLFQKHCDCPAERPFCCKTGWQGFFQGFFRAVKQPQKLNLELSFETQSNLLTKRFSAVKMKLFELYS